MENFTLSIFSNQILLEVIKEIKLFSKFKIKYFDELNYQEGNFDYKKNLVIFFYSDSTKKFYDSIINKNLPMILIQGNKKLINFKVKKFVEIMDIPFGVLDLEKKITSLFAKFEFNISSLINLGKYIVDKNERKISRNNKTLQLTEKEIDFLILFRKNEKPIKKDYILKKVWKYSSLSETHTVDTHIHRLRKKILTKFGDDEFIKNNKEGYYI